MISKKQIENRINNFLGYGNIDSNIWFVCMEEGFHGTPEDMNLRFDATKDEGVIDIADDMVNVPDHIKYFLGRNPIQRTWSKLIIMLLAFEGRNINTELVREYQKNNFGRKNSNHCILDFMPLPSKSVNENDWKYSDLSISYLSTRSEYFQEVAPRRVKLFQNFISKCKPKIIIFSSISYLPYWTEIAQCEFKGLDRFYFSKKDGINYFVIPHPVTRGLSNSDWEEMALKIKDVSIQ